MTPVWIGYSISDGSVANEVCYWRDMTFLPHFLRLLTKRSIRARVVYGQPVQGEKDRKCLARIFHARVSAMAETSRGRLSFAIRSKNTAC